MRRATLLFAALLACTPAGAVTKVHTVTLGKAIPVMLLVGPAEDKTLDITVRPLIVDGHDPVDALAREHLQVAELLFLGLVRVAEEDEVVQVARRVLHRELSVDPSLLADLAAEGIDALGPKERLIVRLGEFDDDTAIETIRARLTARAPQCQVLQDPTLSRGACVVETEYGSVDESLEARLASVVAALGVAGEAAKP